MSVFEQNIMTKIYIDDTDVLLANVINSEYIDGHTVSKLIISLNPRLLILNKFQLSPDLSSKVIMITTRIFVLTFIVIFLSF